MESYLTQCVKEMTENEGDAEAASDEESEGSSNQE